MRTISEVLDRAKKVQKVRSFYKLALCLGIGQTSLTNYRSGRSLPDEKTCEKLSVAMGEDPIILLIEVQAQRTKDDTARARLEALVKRLQMGFSSVLFSCVLAIVAIAVNALPVSAATDSFKPADGPTVYYVKSVKEAARLFLREFVIIGKRLSFFWLACINFHEFGISSR